MLFEMFNDNVFYVFSTKIDNLAIYYPLIVTVALLNFFGYV